MTGPSGPAAHETAASHRGGSSEAGGRERRRYPRLRVPMLYRPAPSVGSAGAASGHVTPAPHRVIDLSMGGARVYSDLRRRPGERVEVELFPPEGASFVVRATVVWVQAIAPGGPALYDVGLKFTDATPDDADRLRAVLEQSHQAG